MSNLPPPTPRKPIDPLIQQRVANLRRNQSAAEAPAPALNRPGFAHLAFAVDDVPAALEAVLAGGGSQHGALHTMAVPGAGEITLVYAADPEGNVIELQQWTAVEKGAGV